MSSPTDALDRFARDFEPGWLLFAEGEPGRHMFVVQAGEVEIRRRLGDEERTIAVFGPGEFFGEMALLNGRPRSATAVVRSRARLLVIDDRTFEAMLRARPEIAVRIVKSLAARLESTNEHVELLLQPTADHRVVHALRQLAAREVRRVGGALGVGTAILVPVRCEELAARVGLPVGEVSEVLERLGQAGLIERPERAGLADGFVLPEVGRLLEFLEVAAAATRSRG